MHPEFATHAGHGSRWPFSTSLALHAVLAMAVLGTSYLVIESVADPKLAIEFLEFAGPPSPPPPPPPAGSSSPAPVIERRIEPPEEIAQPQELPERLPVELIPPESSASDRGVEGGSDDGVMGGTRGGRPGGVPGGDLDGIVGGVGTAPGPAPVVPTPDMTPPVLVRKVEPEYPETARVARVSGRVVLQAVIERSGEIGEVLVLRSSSPLLESAAIDAVRQWKYEPALENGRPVAVYFTVVVEFALH